MGEKRRRKTGFQWIEHGGRVGKPTFISTMLTLNLLACLILPPNIKPKEWWMKTYVRPTPGGLVKY